MAITTVTRRALVADMRAQTVSWSGDCRDEVVFLDRLYDLTKLPSDYGPSKTARDDAIRHLINNPDWDLEEIMDDLRFKLSSGDDTTLLAFLAETIHPEVQTNQDEVQRVLAIYNNHLQPDGWELYPASMISRRPVFGWRPVAAPVVSLQQIIEAIADAVATLKSYEVEKFCTDVLSLAPSEGDQDDPHRSKRFYVRKRISTLSREALLDLADRVLGRFEDANLRAIVDVLRAGGPPIKHSAPKNLVFGSNRKKYKMVLTDAIDNEMEFAENEGGYLHYKDPIGDSGLSWRQLVAWWKDTNETDEVKRGRALYYFLLESLDDGPEKLIFSTYARMYGEFGFDIPALVPQVFIYYDPYSKGASSGALAQQRMDFLLLVPRRRRIVIELDGIQHYATDSVDPATKQKTWTASPKLYGEMLREDRKMRLAGYELFRFGGSELHDPEVGSPLVRQFFIDLLRACDVTLEPVRRS